jgi:hypothetical protein
LWFRERGRRRRRRKRSFIEKLFILFLYCFNSFKIWLMKRLWMVQQRRGEEENIWGWARDRENKLEKERENVKEEWTQYRIFGVSFKLWNCWENHPTDDAGRLMCDRVPTVNWRERGGMRDERGELEDRLTLLLFNRWQFTCRLWRRKIKRTRGW